MLFALLACHPTEVAPAPAPPVPSAAPARSDPLGKLLERGWRDADRDRDASAATFREALALEPGNEEAHYGLGYVLLMQHQDELATVELCQAKDSPEPDIRQDVAGLLHTRGLECR